MPVLDKLACRLGRRDEVPNQELARALAESEDTAGIKEIADNLFNKDKNIQSDCIKVMYEAGYIRPELIAGYAGSFLKLLGNRNNRLVWGAMIALSTIAKLKADEIYPETDMIYRAMKGGSVITVDNGIRVLAGIASQNEIYNRSIFPYLLNHLRTCRPREVGQHAESAMPAVNSRNKSEFMRVLNEREISLAAPQLARIKKLYKSLL